MVSPMFIKHIKPLGEGSSTNGRKKELGTKSLLPLRNELMQSELRLENWLKLGFGRISVRLERLDICLAGFILF